MKDLWYFALFSHYQSPHIIVLWQILKDIVNRYKLLQGYKIHYVPGWDCHGMPIEQKALGELRLDNTDMSAMDIRNTGIANFLVSEYECWYNTSNTYATEKEACFHDFWYIQFLSLGEF